MARRWLHPRCASASLSAPITKPASSRLPAFPPRPDPAPRRNPRHQQRQHRSTPAPWRRAIPGVRVVDEPRKGLVVARETGPAGRDRRHPRLRRRRLPRAAALARAGRAPVPRSSPALVAVTGPYRFYDWDWRGRALIRAYDLLVAPPTHVARARMHSASARSSTAATSPSGATRWTRIGGFDTPIEFHGEDTNLGRRLTPLGRVALCPRLLGLDVGAPLSGDGQAARCSASTCATSGPRSSAIVRRTATTST